MRAIDWARQQTAIQDMGVAKILNARNTFLFRNSQPWVKKNKESLAEDNFDVSMGSYDSSECSDLIGLFILSKLSNIIGSGNGGLYKDDGLLAIQGSGPEIEKIKKSIVALFKGMDMSIEIGNTCVRTDYLDIIIDLENDTYEPFTKENSTIQYIDQGTVTATNRLT